MHIFLLNSHQWYRQTISHWMYGQNISSVLTSHSCAHMDENQLNQYTCIQDFSTYVQTEFKIFWLLVRKYITSLNPISMIINGSDLAQDPNYIWR